jgi:EAL domain-containing protein (putative c-di-GMP-specific phosphodiesterase class I)
MPVWYLCAVALSSWVNKSFVMTMEEQASDTTIVRSIVDLAGHLGLTVVAEGIEDAATWADLEAMGCDPVQGYYLARPMRLADLDVWLARREVTVSGSRG